jgi:Alr-MurF fusion protein
MIEYSIKAVACFAGGELVERFYAKIKYILIDSRSLVSATDTVFFAIEGERHDGHVYIAELYAKNLRNFVVSTKFSDFDLYPEANFVTVNNTLDALQKLVAYHRKQFNYPVIAITGSNGKTIVKEWIFQALQNDRKIIRSPKSYNSQVGVPLSVWSMDDDYNLAVFEAGISMPGEMQKLHDVLLPKIGLFTNIGDAHQENFANIEQKIDEKLQLFYNCRTLIYCRDYELIDQQIKKCEHLNRTILFTWSRRHDADLMIRNISVRGSQTLIQAKFEDHPIEIMVPFTDNASIENCIHVWTLMLFMGYCNDYIREHIKHLTPVAMRLELKHGINDCTIINDSYNSDLNSLQIALDFLNQQNQHSRKTLILSDILQSGKNNDELCREVSALLLQKKIDSFIGIGSILSQHASLFPNGSRFYSSTQNFLDSFVRTDFNNQAILLKGARSFEFEKISHILEQKAHRTALQINLNAMIHNLNYFRSKLNPRTRIMAMVKAFSYGSGSFEIANMLQFQRVDYLAVAFADEGIALRQAGIIVPILVMNPESTSFDIMIDYKLEPEIYNLHVLRIFNDIAGRKGCDASPVHLKLDTGMHRMGFMSADIDALIDELPSFKNISVKSIFTHLAGADEEQHDDYTRAQICLFDKMSNEIREILPYQVLRHVANSAGIERFPEAQFDMVRLGIGLYGVSSVDQSKLQNVSSLISNIVQIKELKAGQTVGYGRKGKAVNDIRIAVVPVGYADGLNRKLSNGVGKFEINGKFAPIIGNICMDLCMVDITGIEAREGDEVIIFGDRYSIIDMANDLGTIPYEVSTSISGRVKRIYYQE